MVKIDIHTHYLPNNWVDLNEKYGYGGWIQLKHTGNGCADLVKDGQLFRKVEENLWDPVLRLEECDKNFINVQVLSTVPIMFNYWAEPQDTYDFARFLNDDLEKTVELFPDRLIGLGTVPMQDPSLAVKELERCMQSNHFCGVQIGTNVNGKNLSEPEFREFFAAAETLGASVFIHPWDMMGEEEMKKYWLPWLVGMPAESSRAICSIIFSGLLEKLPNLKLAFAHGGGSFPGTVDRIEHGYNTRPDLCAVDGARNPKSFLGNFWVDSLVHSHNCLDQIITIFGEDKIALGSDYPFPLGEKSPGNLIISHEHLPEDVKSKLLGLNALDWLGMNASNFCSDL